MLEGITSFKFYALLSSSRTPRLWCHRRTLPPLPGWYRYTSSWLWRTPANTSDNRFSLMFAVQAKMEECMYARSLKAMEFMESSRSISFWRSSFMVMTWTLAIHAYAGNHECRSSQVPTQPNPTLARLDEYWSRKRQNICMIISHYLLLASIRYSIEIMSNHSLLLA